MAKPVVLWDDVTKKLPADVETHLSATFVSSSLDQDVDGVKNFLHPPTVNGAVISGAMSDAQLAAAVGTGVTKTTLAASFSRKFQINVMDFGAVGDGVANDTAALNAAIAEVNTHPKGAKLLIPAGTYKVTAALTPITVPVWVLGDGMGWHAQGSPAATKIICNAGVGGLNLTATSDFSRVEGFDIVSLSTVAENFDGLTLRGNQPQVIGVACEGFGRYGFNLDTSAASGNICYGKFDSCRAYGNRSHGWFVEGQDSQALLFMACDATSNLGWGFYNGASCNNTHIASSAQGNTLGAFYDNASSNTYLNPYIESGVGNNVTFDANACYATWQAGAYCTPVITWTAGSLGTSTVTVAGAQWDHISITGTGNIKYGFHSGHWNGGWFSLRDDTNLVEILDCAPNGGAINLRVPLAAVGTVGFNGKAPAARPTLPAAATDAATTMALANAIRTALINVGLTL